VVVEGRKERYTKTAVGHGIKQAVTCSYKEEIQPHSEHAHAGHPLSKSQGDDDQSQKSSEGQ
jgi:hypothetical protein